MDRPFVSVIVPVYRDRERLITCLQALEAQSYPANRYEIITVDNGDNGDLGALCQSSARTRVVAETIPSSYAARNRGVGAAMGEILAFTDADCIPAPDWLEKGVAALESVPNCGMVGGAVHTFVECPGSPNSVELYDLLMFQQQEQLVKEERFAVTANLFTFRHVFLDLGPFDPELKSGGDKEFGQRVHAHGYTQLFAQDAIVEHPALSSYSGLYRKICRILGGELALKKRKGYGVLDLAYETLGDLVGIPRSLHWAWKDKRLTRSWDRLRFAAVMTFTRVVRIVERIRLLAGGTPRR